MELSESDTLLTLPEAARAVGRNISTVDGWLKRGRLKPAGQLWRRCRWVPVYRLADVQALADTRERCTVSRTEPTAEEVDALVAFQLRPENLPPWWPKVGPDVDPEGDE